MTVNDRKKTLCIQNVIVIVIFIGKGNTFLKNVGNHTGGQGVLEMLPKTKLHI